jgi:hypothetical protein
MNMPTYKVRAIFALIFLFAGGVARAEGNTCVFSKTTTAVQTLRITVCLSGKSGSLQEKPIVDEASVQIENISSKKIELRHPIRSDLFFVASSKGLGSVFAKPIPMPAVDTAAYDTFLKRRSVILGPGDRHKVSAPIADLFYGESEAGAAHSLGFRPSFLFKEFGSSEDFLESRKRMDGDTKFQRSLSFEEVRIK